MGIKFSSLLIFRRINKMAEIKVKNVGTSNIGFDVAGTQYDIAVGGEHLFPTTLEEEVQAAIAVFGADLELEYVTPE